MRQQAGRQAGRRASMEMEGKAGPRLCISEQQACRMPPPQQAVAR
jgi:hypothetical protein